MLSRRLRGVLAGISVLPLLAVTACNSSTDVDRFALEELQANQDRWHATGPPQSYSMRVVRNTQDDPNGRPVRLQVSGGAVVSGIYDDTQEPLPAQVLATHLTIDGMFTLIRNAISGGVSQFVVQYDQQYGFPEDIRIQYSGARLGDFVAIFVTGFTVTAGS